MQLVWVALVASWKLDNNIMKSIISLRSGGDFQPIGHVLIMKYFNNRPLVTVSSLSNTILPSLHLNIRLKKLPEIPKLSNIETCLRE